MSYTSYSVFSDARSVQTITSFTVTLYGRPTISYFIKVKDFRRYRGADKSLARPGKKQATQKNSEGCPSKQVSAAAMTSASAEKWRPFNCFFSRVRLTTYQHPMYM